METESKVKRALKNRELTIGTWMQSSDPDIAETLVNCGYDWITADIEHTHFSLEAFSNMARALKGGPALPFARVRENATMAIRGVLDMGAQGIFVPLIDSAEAAEQAVRAAKYPPEGIRGFAFCRANQWGTDFDAYSKNANQNIAVIVMIESRAGVENIDAILAVDGVDGVFIGPYDMSGSYGVTGQTGHKLIVDACDKVSAACAKQGKSAGLHIVLPTEHAVRDAVNKGFTLLALGTDHYFLRQSAEKAARFGVGL